MENTKIIEINGVKLEVDLRTAKEVKNYRVGDKVKVLKKNYDSYKSYAGVIVSFDNFKNLPTMVVAYLKSDYSDTTIEFAYINSQTDDIEITFSNENDVLFNKADVIQKIDSEILKKEENIKDLQNKKEYFISHFHKYFEIKED